MTNQEIQNLLEGQRAYYRSGATIPVRFRIEQLKKLYAVVKKYQNEINEALRMDLGKSNRLIKISRRKNNFVCIILP